jgi:transposase
VHLDSGELGVSVLRMAPLEVVGVFEKLGPGVVAVYEAGPTGFELARAGRERGIDVRVLAPGSIPKGSGDRVKTDRRDAIRLVRLLPPVSCPSRSCRLSRTSASVTWCAASRTSAAI